LRFERTRVFGVVRRIFLALGERLAASGSLSTARDVFYLTREELFGHVTGAGATSDLRALVTLRKAEFTGYLEMAPPPDRFETFGPPSRSVLSGKASEALSGDLQGTGCCPGVVKGRVTIVREPQLAPDLTGRILVAERTDPGWTLLFPTAAGLLVQRGSLLSHSAIVARETGLPCIVGVAGLLETLREGEWVEMDGASGVVRRLADG
jgi:pyruvate,water dikinase